MSQGKHKARESNWLNCFRKQVWMIRCLECPPMPRPSSWYRGCTTKKSSIILITSLLLRRISSRSMERPIPRPWSPMEASTTMTNSWGHPELCQSEIIIWAMDLVLVPLWWTCNPDSDSRIPLSSLMGRSWKDTEQHLWSVQPEGQELEHLLSSWWLNLTHQQVFLKMLSK